MLQLWTQMRSLLSAKVCDPQMHRNQCWMIKERERITGLIDCEEFMLM